MKNLMMIISIIFSFLALVTFFAGMLNDEFHIGTIGPAIVEGIIGLIFYSIYQSMDKNEDLWTFVDALIGKGYELTTLNNQGYVIFTTLTKKTN